MGVDALAEYNGSLPTIEWEGLQQGYQIKENINAKFLTNTNNNTIKLVRDKHYKIRAIISGLLINEQKELDKEKGIAGELVSPTDIVGTNNLGLEKYELSQSYLGDVNYRWVPNALGAYDKKYEAILNTFHVRRFYDYNSSVVWLTEWFLNGPRGPFWYLRSTERKFSETFERNRSVYKNKENKFSGELFEGFNDDYLFVKLSKYSFIIHKVPKHFGPSWSENIGIEYRKEFGIIPDANEREAISEIVGFIFGKQLKNIGYTTFNEFGMPIEEVALNPWGNDVESICNSYELSPIFKGEYKEMGKVEAILEQIIPKYLALRNEFNLDEALWRYWLANNMPVGTNLPMLMNGIEIISKAWFASKKSKTNGVYLQKKEFDILLKNELNLIEMKVKGLEYGDRIINRMKGNFQMGANERMEIFFKEIGLEVGEVEKNAIKSRNVMIHSSYGSSPEEIRKIIKLTDAYKSFFNRVFLKLLGYEETYIDYYTLGHPHRLIDEVVGGKE